MKQDPTTSTNHIKGFAIILNDLFVAMVSEWQESHKDKRIPPIAMMVAELALTWLQKVHSDKQYHTIIETWAQNPKFPNPYALYEYATVKERTNREQLLEQAAHVGHCQSMISLFDLYAKNRKMSKGRNIMEHIRSLLIVLLSNIDNVPCDKAGVLDRIWTLVRGYDDPQANQILIEYYLSEYHKIHASAGQEYLSKALQLYGECSLTKNFQCNLAHRELRSGNPQFQRRLAFKLLTKSSARQRSMGAMLFCNVVMRMQEQGLTWHEIIPPNEKIMLLTLDSVTQTRCHQFERLWGLWMIALHQEDGLLSDGFSALKHAFLEGNTCVWHDLLRIANDTTNTNNTRSRLLAHKCLIEICGECAERSLEIAIDQISTFRKMIRPVDDDHTCREFKVLDAQVEMQLSKLACLQKSRHERTSFYARTRADMNECVDHSDCFVSLDIDGRMSFIRECGGIQNFPIKAPNILQDALMDERSLALYIAYVHCAKAELSEHPELLRKCAIDNGQMCVWEKVQVLLSFAKHRFPEADVAAQIVSEMICQAKNS